MVSLHFPTGVNKICKNPFKTIDYSNILMKGRKTLLEKGEVYILF